MEEEEPVLKPVLRSRGVGRDLQREERREGSFLPLVLGLLVVVLLLLLPAVGIALSAYFAVLVPLLA